MEDKSKFIDALLDSALAHRRKAAPSPGLEARILEGVRTASGKGSSPGAVWHFPAEAWLATAVVVAAVATIFIVARLGDRQHVASIQTPQARKTVSTQPPKESVAASPKAAQSAGDLPEVVNPKPPQPHKTRQARRAKASHWSAQFPTPAPLSPEEKALIRYVRETPPQVLATPLLKEQSSNHWLEIKPLKFPPLEIQPLSLGPNRAEEQ